MSDFQKVLITGATGFIGSNLVKGLVREKRDVHVITRASSNLNVLFEVRDFIHVHVYDGSFDCLLKIFREVQPSTVFHLASEFVAQHQPSQVNSLLQNNVVFPAQLTEAMAICGIKRFINTGTSWKYFNSTEYRPVNLYAATKQAFRDILEYYGRDFAEPKKKQLGTVGYSQAIPFPLQPANLPQQNEAPNLPAKTFW
mgnify:CR=1 FL=1